MLHHHALISTKKTENNFAFFPNQSSTFTPNPTMGNAFASSNNGVNNALNYRNGTNPWETNDTSINPHFFEIIPANQVNIVRGFQIVFHAAHTNLTNANHTFRLLGYNADRTIGAELYTHVGAMSGNTVYKFDAFTALTQWRVYRFEFPVNYAVLTLVGGDRTSLMT